MARPIRAVVDYFPHYVNHGKTLYTVESKYGNDGYAFWFKLLELLGATENHFIDCRQVSTWEFLLAKTHFSEDSAIEILNLLAKLGAIDAELWGYRIIWSANFIENIADAYKRRVISAYTKTDILGFCIQKPSGTDKSANINPQSKVDQSKVNQSKVNQSDPTDTNVNKNGYKNLCDWYCNLTGHPAVYSHATVDMDRSFVKQLLEQISLDRLLAKGNEVFKRKMGSTRARDRINSIRYFFPAWEELLEEIQVEENTKQEKIGQIRRYLTNARGSLKRYVEEEDWRNAEREKQRVADLKSRLFELGDATVTDKDIDFIKVKPVVMEGIEESILETKKKLGIVNFAVVG